MQNDAGGAGIVSFVLLGRVVVLVAPRPGDRGEVAVAWPPHSSS